MVQYRFALHNVQHGNRYNAYPEEDKQTKCPPRNIFLRVSLLQLDRHLKLARGTQHVSTISEEGEKCVYK